MPYSLPTRLLAQPHATSQQSTVPLALDYLTPQQEGAVLAHWPKLPRRAGKTENGEKRSITDHGIVRQPLVPKRAECRDTGHHGRAADAAGITGVGHISP